MTKKFIKLDEKRTQHDDGWLITRLLGIVGMDSLDRELVYDDDVKAVLYDIVPDKRNEEEIGYVRMRSMLSVVYTKLNKAGKKREAQVLELFIKGLHQSDMPRKLGVNKQRVNQIVVSLRDELKEYGITGQTTFKDGVFNDSCRLS